MQLSTAISLLAIAAVAVARNCTPGLTYCQDTLLDIGKHQNPIPEPLPIVVMKQFQKKKPDPRLIIRYAGKYQPQIDQSLSDARIVSNGNALFYCVGGSNGVISFIINCQQGCHDAGPKKNDFCN